MSTTIKDSKLSCMWVHLQCYDFHEPLSTHCDYQHEHDNNKNKFLYRPYHEQTVHFRLLTPLAGYESIRHCTSPYTFLHNSSSPWSIQTEKNHLIAISNLDFFYYQVTSIQSFRWLFRKPHLVLHCHTTLKYNANHEYSISIRKYISESTRSPDSIKATYLAF